MQWLRSITITRTLYLVCTLVAAVLLLVSFQAVRDLRGAALSARQIETTRTPQLGRADQAELSVTRASLLLRHAMLARTPQERNTALQEMKDRAAALDQTLQLYESHVSSEGGRAVYRAVPDLARRFKDLAIECVRLIEAGDQALAFAFLADQLVPVRNQLLQALSEIKKYEGQRLDAEVLAISDRLDRTLYVVMGSGLLVVVGLFGTCMLVGATLRGRAARAAKVVERVKNFDLRHEVVDRRNDEFSGLMASMNEMQDALADVVNRVRANADQVARASSEISQGNQDLSARTEQQASNLQNTASTMDELGATVRQNADGARQANSLAQGASGVAQRGGQVVAQVVQTMGAISSSSRKIGDIIGVIDSIAFQTNILALNAAVEAARAGESGRGFAVVASEVRQLAQRSAEAAREIKQLISASLDKVDLGASQADVAGKTMVEVVDAIRKVTELVGEIAHASHEQAEGVQLAARAITEMDRGTQQNAALVEQSAAAAESLKHQAQSLVAAVAAFKVEDPV